MRLLLAILESPVLATLVAGIALLCGVYLFARHIGKPLLHIAKELEEANKHHREANELRGGGRLSDVRDGIMRHVEDALTEVNAATLRLGRSVERDSYDLRRRLEALEPPLPTTGTDYPAEPTWGGPTTDQTDVYPQVDAPGSAINPDRTGAILSGNFGGWNAQQGAPRLAFDHTNEAETKRVLLSFVQPTTGEVIELWEYFPTMVKGQWRTYYEVAVARLSASPEVGFDVLEAGLLKPNIEEQFPSLLAHPGYLAWRNRHNNQ